MRAIKNAIDDGNCFNLFYFNKIEICIVIYISDAVVPGAGAFEILAWQELQKYKDEIKGKSRLGIQAFAEALLIIPKTICMFYLNFINYNNNINFNL